MTPAALILALATGAETPAPQAPHRQKELTIALSAVGSAHDFLVGRVDNQVEHPMSTGIPMFSGGAELVIGIVRAAGPAPAAVTLRYERGATNFGLGTHFATFGIEGLQRIDRSAFSVFGGLHAGVLVIERATDAPAIGHWGIGADAGANVDLLPIGYAGALFVRPTLDATIVPHALLVMRSLLWGASLGAGIRF